MTLADLFTNLANAIRAKGGTSASLYPNQMAQAIADIQPQISLQTKSKSYAPSETAQSEAVGADSGYDGLQQVNVSVGAIPAAYVGSGVTRRSSSDLSASGETVSVPAGYYENAASKAVASGTEGTPIAEKGSVSNHAVTVTPKVTNAAGYIAGGTRTGSGVTVQASELVSGKKTITANDTDIDVTEYASVDVAVPTGGGGASNIVEGTFITGSSAGAYSISLPYTGNGYPIACMVFIAKGAYNSSNTGWYNSLRRYAVGQWTMHKAVQDTAPTYATSGTENYGVTTAIYKNSTSSATSYTRTSEMNTNAYSSSNASNAALTCVRLKRGNVLSYYVNTSSYGLLPNMEYKYIVIYSE